jgi:hypothetical protein
VLGCVKDDAQAVAPYIDMLFNIIAANNPFQEVRMHNLRVLHYLSIDVLRAQAIIQWMKILKSLTFADHNCSLKQNQQKILNHILRLSVIGDIVKPITPQYLANFSFKFSTSTNEYWKLKMHVEAVQLLTDSVKNYRLGI